MRDSCEGMGFEEVYVSYYARLRRFACNYVISQQDAEDIVHDVFVSLWENWDTLQTHSNLFAFLFLSIRNRCIDFLRRKSLASKAEGLLAEEYHLAMKANLNSLEALQHTPLSVSEVEQILSRALDALPERCREIFKKSRLEGKKQADIAREMNISVNTVESQMAIAYRKLREQLKEMLPLLIFLLV